MAYWLRREWLPMEALLVSFRRAARVPPLTVMRPETADNAYRAGTVRFNAD